MNKTKITKVPFFRDTLYEENALSIYNENITAFVDKLSNKRAEISPGNIPS